MVQPGISSAASGVSLTAPRLQLRWEPNTGKQRFASGDGRLEKLIGRPIEPTPEWLCHYELVLPLRKFDVRREVYGPRGGRRPDKTELVAALKSATVRASTATPCTVTDTGERFADTPYRDGCHAAWDSALLGDLPVYVIAPDGWAMIYADSSERSVPAREGE